MQNGVHAVNLGNGEVLTSDDEVSSEELDVAFGEFKGDQYGPGAVPRNLNNENSARLNEVRPENTDEYQLVTDEADDDKTVASNTQSYTYEELRAYYLDGVDEGRAECRVQVVNAYANGQEDAYRAIQYILVKSGGSTYGVDEIIAHAKQIVKEQAKQKAKDKGVNK